MRAAFLLVIVEDYNLRRRLSAIGPSSIMRIRADNLIDGVAALVSTVCIHTLNKG
jgi:hypothetical protein